MVFHVGGLSECLDAIPGHLIGTEHEVLGVRARHGIGLRTRQHTRKGDGSVCGVGRLVDSRGAA